MRRVPGWTTFFTRLLLSACDAPVFPRDGTSQLAANPGASELLTGDVVFRSVAGSSHLALLLDAGSPSAPPDGRIDEAFVLQREGFLQPIRPLVLRRARVRVRDALVELGDETGRSVAVLSLDREGAIRERRRSARAGMVGYGLARRSIGGELGFEDAVEGDIGEFLPTCRRPAVRAPGLFFQGVGPVDDPLTCHSGGPNSSSCSTSCNVLSEPKSCSVQCVSGSYACCDMNQCKCQCQCQQP